MRNAVLPVGRIAPERIDAENLAEHLARILTVALLAVAGHLSVSVAAIADAHVQQSIGTEVEATAAVVERRKRDAHEHACARRIDDRVRLPRTRHVPFGEHAE